MSDPSPIAPIAVPAGRSWKTRAWLYLYGNPNLVGCGLALLGPALLFAGVIGPGWLAITAGLYAVGALVGASLARTPEIERRIEAGLDVAEILQHLDAIVAKAAPQLDDEMNRRLQSVRDSVAEVLPRLVGTESFDANLFTVRQTVLRYLPETLANYVALPRLFRASHVLRDGKTARALLGEQLAILDETLQRIVANVASRDADALVVNGQFLEAKFRQPDLLAE